MSYETNHCNRIVCDYPDCDATTRLWRENEDSAYSDADDLKWLTIEVESDGDEYVERHFCPRHLDTTRPEWASGYILPDVLVRNGIYIYDLVAEYSLKDMSKPIGVSAYQVTSKLPEELEKQLPSVEDIQKRIK